MADLLDRREVRIRRMFDGIAGKYDFLNHLLSLNIDKRWRKTVTKLVPVQTGPLLDLCTGTGDLAFEYDRVTGGKIAIIGADFSPRMLERAVWKNAKAQSQSRIQFVEADAQHLPFADNTFEVATISFGLRNVTNPDLGLREMTRAVRSGGRVAVLEFSKPRHWLLGKMYTGYFKHVLPRIGQAFSKSDEQAYAYLPASVMEFPDGEALAEKMRAAGLTQVWFRPLTFGIATLYVGTKP
ncbi:MAG: bifunctional demethylmenaquinone methyltransferase/2-methoxy-6-polyprenyl-1,4-benzoquinol methylase UbiE [Gemmataceae bacterium]|jgi:demethylmenaquinone methyltransferase/2-methoxy-6-polyprenyl-1,4-benzoquinol methylase|nr:bifunctional demethylmenaquinone methyltransferase/2-methoxy-6-polyprenyl-1,4-benzoquinol methylase UbiE [Gemmataceae bacterium]